MVDVEGKHREQFVNRLGGAGAFTSLLVTESVTSLKLIKRVQMQGILYFLISTSSLVCCVTYTGYMFIIYRFLFRFLPITK